MTLVISNDEIARLVGMPQCIAKLEAAYLDLARGSGISRRRSDCLVPTPRDDGALYGLKSMDGVAPALGIGAVRINSDILTWPEIGGKRRRVKVPAAPGDRYVGLVLLFDTATGAPLAIVPDGVLQRMRVGATNGLAIKHLARRDATTVGLLGSGWQAGAQVMAAHAVRPITRVNCFSPDREHREAFCREWSARLGSEFVPVATPEAALREADIAICATSSIEPIFAAEWVRQGMHLSSIKRPELAPEAIRMADLFVIHSRHGAPEHVVSSDLPATEADSGRGWALLGEFDFAALPTLPELVAGTVAGRRDDRQVTCFVNNIGLGYQFAVVGAVLLEAARDSGLGRQLPTEWFTQLEHP